MTILSVVKRLIGKIAGATHGSNTHFLGKFIGAQVESTHAAIKIVPFGQSTVVAILAGIEFGQVIGGCDAARAVEIFVLTDSTFAGFFRFPFGSDADGIDFSLIDGDRVPAKGGIRDGCLGVLRYL